MAKESIRIEDNKKLLNKIINNLYTLEDRTFYKIKKITKAIELLNKIIIK